METFSFENLNAYKESRLLTMSAYGLIAQFPQHERYALGAQMQRSMISVPSNIAEGSGRRSVREKIRFREIAFGSPMESYCQLQIAMDPGYLTQPAFDEIKPKFFTVGRLINGLTKSFEAKLQSISPSQNDQPITP